MGSELTVVFVRVWVREYGRVAGDDGFDGALRLGAIGVVWVDAISYYSDPP
jgi:hypothetical protein